MRKLLLATLGVLTLLLLGPTLEVAQAQRAGRSFSSGSRSFSSGSRGFSSGGRSYSSGSRSYSSGGKSYSSGNKSFSSGSGSSTPKFGSGSSPSSKPSGSGWGWSTPSPSVRPGTPSTRPPTSSPVRPTPPRFDSLAGEAQKKAESRALYERGKAPASTYTPRNAPANAKPIPLDDKDRRIRELREELTHERWLNRYDRQRSFYGSYGWYSNPPPIIYYHDPYSNFFWWWLLAQSLDTRANWAYHHRNDMDQRRYEELLRQDEKLKARVEQLEKDLTEKKVPRDPTWMPEEVQKQGRDLAYKDGYVDSVYNPQPKVSDGTYPHSGPTASRPPPHPAAAWGGFLVFLLVLAFIGFMIWLVFFKRWGET